MTEPWVDKELAHPAAPVLARLMGSDIERMEDDEKVTLASCVRVLEDVVADRPEPNVHLAARSLGRIREHLSKAEKEARSLPEHYLRLSARADWPDGRALPDAIAALDRALDLVDRLVQRDAPRVPKQRGRRQQPRENVAGLAAWVYSQYCGIPEVSANPDHTPKAGFALLSDELIRAALPNMPHRPTSWYKPTVDAVKAVTSNRRNR